MYYVRYEMNEESSQTTSTLCLLHVKWEHAFRPSIDTPAVAFLALHITVSSRDTLLHLHVFHADHVFQVHVSSRSPALF
jgi:hypothetical protein